MNKIPANLPGAREAHIHIFIHADRQHYKQEVLGRSNRLFPSMRYGPHIENEKNYGGYVDIQTAR
jgi:hypothetical protein